MNRFLLPILSVAAAMLPYVAAGPGMCGAGDEKPDDIVGVYHVSHGGEESRVRVFRLEDDSYSAQVVWVRDSLDRDGNIRLDEKNPDKSLRSVPCNRLMIMSGLKYDTVKSRWAGGKIYDPTRGLRANVVCDFKSADTLAVRGSLPKPKSGCGEMVDTPL